MVLSKSSAKKFCSTEGIQLKKISTISLVNVGLQIGSYRKQAQIGTVYNNSVGRMPEYVWKQHVRLINEPRLYYPELTPIEITTQLILLL